MGKEDISSDEQMGLKKGPRSAEPSRNNGAHSNARTTSDTKSRKKKTNSKKTLDPGITQITIAVIGLIGTITVAALGYMATRPDPTPVPVFTFTAMPSPTVHVPDIPATFTELPSATFTPLSSATSIVTATAIPSETMTLVPQPKLIVFLQANKTSGRAPLSVKLDARDSYLTDYDGQRHVCHSGTCHYTWKIYANGQQLGKSVTDSGGTFDYKFGRKGIYTVTVWICRGQDRLDCGGSGVQIVVS